MFSYTAYGLVIHSELLIPELPIHPGEPDVWIRLGQVTSRMPTQSDCRYNFRMEPNAIYLSWQDAGIFLVRNGREIIVDPQPGTDEAVIRLLLGGALTILLYQRGVLVLHASVAAIHETAVAFLGEKGSGKSTLAAALHTRGHTFLSDDSLAIDFAGSSASVRPGSPQLKLWPDSVHSLGDDPEVLPRLHKDFEKRAFQVTENFCRRSLPLRSIYLLAEGTLPEIEAEPPQTALTEVMRHSQAFRFFKEQGSTPEHFLQCARLVNAVPIYRLKRPHDLDLLARVAELVEEHHIQDSSVALESFSCQ